MPDYANGKIYLIQEIETGSIFCVGSTTTSLRRRWACYRCEWRRWQEGRSDRIPHSFFGQIQNISDCQIVLFEIYPCTTSRELFIREGAIQERYADQIYNQNRAGRPKAERQAERQAARYDNDRANGTCASCGCTQVVVPGKVRCLVCLQKQSDSYKARYQKKKSLPPSH